MRHANLSPARRAVSLSAAGIALIAVSYGLARFAYGLFAPSFRSAFDLDSAATGAIASESYLAYCAGVAVATFATPRLGARAVAVGAGLAATLGTALIGLAPDVALLAVGVIVAGTSTGIASPPLAHAVSHGVAPRYRDRTQTVINAGTGLGVMVSGPVALLFADQWRTAWLAFSLLAALATIWVACAVPAARVRAVPSPRPGRTGRMPRRGAGRLGAAAALAGAGSAAMWTFGQDLLTESTGGVLATVAWIVLGACGLLGAAAGDLVRRWGLATTWAVLVLLMAASTALIAVAPGIPALALLTSAVFGAVYIAATGVLLLWSVDVFDDAPARGVGTAFLLLALGQAAAAPAWGLVADAAGTPVAFFAAAAVGLVSLVMRPSQSSERRTVPRSGRGALAGTAPEDDPG
ncbi:MFS transporter [Microbacterium sp. 179-I 3D4 NHS]|uniref:MFS transporter n=1 Tax=Microbacterium sp. 179-I 3D4 NHS TaxID=3142381 RepID=UPI0039A02827